MVLSAAPSWSDRRNEFRSPVALCAHVRGVRWSAGRIVELSNLSCAGCSLQCNSFVKGDQLWIRFAGLSPIRATVQWSDERGAGVSFSRRLSRYVVEHISRGYGSSSDASPYE